MAEMSDHQDSEHFTYDRNWEEIENMLEQRRMQTNGLTVFTMHKFKETVEP